MDTSTPTNTGTAQVPCNAMVVVPHWEVIGKARYDWMRAQNNLKPRAMDWQDKVVVCGSLVVSVFFLLVLALG